MIKAKIIKMMDNIIELRVKKGLAISRISNNIKNKLNENSGNWLDESFKYILAVVIGLAFLAGLYAITKDTILPTLTQKIKDGFSFKG